MFVRSHQSRWLPGSMEMQWVHLLAMIGLTLFAAFFRFEYVNSVVVDSPWRADSGMYVKLAVNLVAHSIYSLAQDSPFTPTHFVSPGYPVYLAIFMRSASTVQEFNAWVLNSQAALGTLSVLLTFMIGRAAGGFCVGLCAAFFLAISPHHIVSSGYLLTETLFTFLLLWACWLVVSNWKVQRWWMWTVIGVVGAVASLVRPVLLIFPLIVAIPLLVQRFSAKSTLLAISWVSVSMIAVNLPWQVWKDTHPAGPEPNLFAAAIQFGGYPDLIYKDPALRGFPYREDPENGRSATTVGALQVIAQRAIAEPARYLLWYFIGKPIMFWQSENLGAVGGAFIYPVTDSIYNHHTWAAWSMNVMMALHPWLSLVAGVTVVWALWRSFRGASSVTDNAAVLLAATLMGAFTIVHMALGPLQRYAYPAYPFAYVLAAFGFGNLIRAFLTQLRGKPN